MNDIKDEKEFNKNIEEKEEKIGNAKEESKNNIDKKFKKIFKEEIKQKIKLEN